MHNKAQPTQARCGCAGYYGVISGCASTEIVLRRHVSSYEALPVMGSR